jgi:hypothetical protein
MRVLPFKEKSPWQNRESNPGPHDQLSETLTTRPRGWSVARIIKKTKCRFGFDKMRGIPLLAEKLLASHKELFVIVPGVAVWLLSRYVFPFAFLCRFTQKA